MLIFSRKKNEAVVIAGGIEIKVLKTSRGRVVLGVNAPGSVAVHRKEILERGASDVGIHHLPVPHPHDHSLGGVGHLDQKGD